MDGLNSSTVFGGHGTVALSMSWTLYEIAKRPEVQARMRAEILEMKAKVDARGDAHFNALDLEGLHYCEAVIRVRFRICNAISSSITLQSGMFQITVYYR